MPILSVHRQNNANFSVIREKTQRLEAVRGCTVCISEFYLLQSIPTRQIPVDLDGARWISGHINAGSEYNANPRQRQNNAILSGSIPREKPATRGGQRDGLHLMGCTFFKRF